jgi:hypothetical protein
MSRRDGKSLAITFNPLELAALLYGFLRGSIDATGGLGEIEDYGTHFLFSTIFWEKLLLVGAQKQIGTPTKCNVYN